MKYLITTLTAFGISLCLLGQSSDSLMQRQTLKMNAGIVTEKLQESKDFYCKVLDFKVLFENEFYVLLSSPNGDDELSFLLPNHPSQASVFQKPFMGSGMYITMEVKNVDLVYLAVKSKGIPIVVDLKDEPWGDRHFAIQDPNGIGIDIVSYIQPEQE